jgi:Ser-tRNA(Ala) deacylase AlaX
VQSKNSKVDLVEHLIKLFVRTQRITCCLQLRKVLGEHVHQRGSNITDERIRIDFAHDAKMTDEQKAEVEKLVNEWIKENDYTNATR